MRYGGVTLFACWLAALAVGCSPATFVRQSMDGGGIGTGGSDQNGESGGSDGFPGTGGSFVSTGGAGETGGAGSGGKSGTGGTGTGATGGSIVPGTGGNTAAGGSSSGGSATGGASPTGGATGTGGSGGLAATGGNNTGGAATGGAAVGGGGASGGSTGTGGATSTGGATAPAGALLYYPFNETSGSSVADQSGGAHNGTVAGGGTFSAGMLKNALTLDGSTGYVTVPAGILDTTKDLSIAFWIKVKTDTQWQRVLDFGKSSTTGYMFITTHPGPTSTNIRFAISKTTNAAEQTVEGTPLGTGTWKHIVLVLSSAGGVFYVDGVKGTANAALTLRPSDLGATTNNWIGRSQYTADPYFAGQIDELSIYGRALTDAEVSTLRALR